MTVETQFGAAQFMLGSVRGYRTWGVKNGSLSPVSYSTYPWVGGENVAECHGYPEKDVVEGQKEDEPYNAFFDRVKVWRGAHDMIDCRHGFYAYFDGSYDNYTSTIGIRGVIEGYGDVLIGTKGFRATKARVLALSLEQSGDWCLSPNAVAEICAKYPDAAIFASVDMMRSEFPADRASAFESVAA